MSFSKEEYTTWLSQLAQAWGPMLRQQKLLLLNAPPGVAEDWQQEVLAKVQELEELLNALGTIASLERGNPILHLAQGELSTWIKAFLEPYVHVANRKGISLQVEIPEVTVNTDQRLIEHLLSTLVGNALRFSKPAGGSIRVLVSAEPDLWKLQVIDNGIGIAKEKLPHAFNPLYADHIHLHLYQPAHLQLFLAQKRVEALGGTLTVESEKGKFTRFTAQFPRWSASPNGLKSLWQSTNWRINPAEVSALSSQPDKPNTTAQRVAWISAHPPQAPWEQRVMWYSTNKLALLEMPVTQPLAIVISSAPPPDLSTHAFLQAIAQDPVLRNIPVVLLAAAPHPLADTTLPPATPAEEWLNKAHHLHARYQSLQHPQKEIAAAPESFVLKARRILDREMGNSHFGVLNLAEQLFLSRSQLHRKISALLGVTPQQFILHHRLDHAQILLQSGRYNVSQVADRCGFSSASHFTRAFKIRFGSSPKEQMRHA